MDRSMMSKNENEIFDKYCDECDLEKTVPIAYWKVNENVHYFSLACKIKYFSPLGRLFVSYNREKDELLCECRHSSKNSN